MRLFLLVLTGCAAPLMTDPSFPTGSSTLALSRDRASVLTLDADAGLVVQSDAASGAVLGQVVVGGEPSRIAPIGSTGRYAVTLRGARSVVVIEETASGLQIVDTVPIGAEPVGVVSDEAGTRLYVAASTENRVFELDGDTLEVLRAFEVAGQPRWLALRPGSAALYAMAAFGESSWIDLETGDVHRLDLPQVDAFTGRLTARVTGDPAVSPDGNELVIPSLYIDNVTPESSLPVYYAMPQKWNPAMVTFGLDGGGEPQPHGDVAALAAASHRTTFIGYPTSVTLDPHALIAYLPIEGADVVVAASVERPRGGGLGAVGKTLRATGDGPNGVAVDDDRAWVHAAFDHAIQPMDTLIVHEALDATDAENTVLSMATLEGPWTIAPATLSVDQELGRHLFTSTSTEAMSSPGSGASCATCHFEGRNDGLTWPLTEGPRQTPSLIGHLSDTLPVTWTSEIPSVEGEVQLTSEGRMGGTGLRDDQRAAIAAYLDTLRPTDVPRGDDAAIARGKVLFERADVGCATCHAGPAYTDHASHEMFGLAAVDTPTLRGVAASAPYVHDGRYPTLSALLRKGDMGDVSKLDDAELADLQTYVESL
jgi:mono/diheme cytochrome c family protein